MAEMPVGFRQFIKSNPTSYANLQGGITFTITGINETNINLQHVEQLPDLAEYIDHSLDQLETILWNTAPVLTTKYRESIEKRFDKDALYGQVGIGAGVVNKKGVNYANFLQFGARTLYNAVDHNARGIHWPYSRRDGSLGILHDTRRLVYAWEHWFFTGLDSVEFSQPRTRGGQFSMGRF